MTTVNDVIGRSKDDAAFELALLQEDLIHLVAERVRLLRKLNDYTQAKLADLVETRQPAIARIEAGEANLTLSSLAHLAMALGCHPGDLVSESPPDYLSDGWKPATTIEPVKVLDLKSYRSGRGTVISAPDEAEAVTV